MPFGKNSRLPSQSTIQEEILFVNSTVREIGQIVNAAEQLERGIKIIEPETADAYTAKAMPGCYTILLLFCAIFNM
jgi:hypothetical protein